MARHRRTSGHVPARDRESAPGPGLKDAVRGVSLSSPATPICCPGWLARPSRAVPGSPLWELLSSLSLELFPLPVLTASPAQPVEGGPVTLTCETQLPPQRSDVRLRFRFFREDQPLRPHWSWSPEFQTLTVWREDSGLYWCQAETVTQSVIKRSRRSHILVQSECQRVLGPGRDRDPQGHEGQPAIPHACAE